MITADPLTAIVVIADDCVDLRLYLLKYRLLAYTCLLIEQGYEIRFLVPEADNISTVQIAGECHEIISLAPALPPESAGPMSPPMLLSRRVYETLKAIKPPTKVVAGNHNGLLYYVLCAQRQGLEFLDTSCDVVFSEPKELQYSLEGTFTETYKDTITMWLERKTVELATQVISHSEALTKWLTENYQRKSSVRHLESYRIPCIPELNSKLKRANSEQQVELVYIGGLTRGNGLVHLLRALKPYESTKPDFSLTFIGKKTIHSSLQRELDYFLDNTCVDINFLDIENNPEELFSYLNHSNRIIISLPVINSTSWPIDLAYRHSLNAITFRHDFFSPHQTENGILRFSELNAASLNHTINEFVANIRENRTTEIRDNFAPEPSDISWLEHSKKQTEISKPIPAREISVCISHYCRPEYLAVALHSLASQSINGFEVVVVDDGSPDEYQDSLSKVIRSFSSKLNIKLIRQSNSYLGATRNKGWTHSSGSYLMFMDDDNIAAHNELETFSKAAAYTNDDILTCFSDTFIDSPFEGLLPPVENRITPIGACLSLGVLFNCFGDSNSFWKKSALQKIGGFTEMVGVGKEDNEIFSRAILKGCTLSVVPEPLFFYRLSKDRMRHHHLNPEAGTHRVLSSYKISADSYTTDLMNLVVGQQNKIQELESKLHLKNQFAERTEARLKVITLLLTSQDTANL